MTSAPARYDVNQLHLLGGNASLDFINTVVWRLGPDADETLRTYDDLLRFAERIDTLDIVDGDALALRADADPDAAQRALCAAHALREAMYRVFVEGEDVDDPARHEADLDTIVAIIRQSAAHLQLCPPKATSTSHQAGTDLYQWGWPSVESLTGVLEDDVLLLRPVWSVVRAATHLLTTGPLERVRQCSGRNCGWVFLDTTKNGRRRWCDSSVCGNRARVRAHYHRHRGANADADGNADADDSAEAAIA